MGEGFLKTHILGIILPFTFKYTSIWARKELSCSILNGEHEFILAPKVAGCGALGRLFNLSNPQIPHL